MGWIGDDCAVLDLLPATKGTGKPSIKEVREKSGKKDEGKNKLQS